MGEYVAAFFLKTLFLTKRGFLFSSGAACSQARFAAFSFAQSGIALESFENPVSNETGFFVLKYSLLIIAVGEVAAPEGTTTQHTTTPWLNTK